MPRKLKPEEFREWREDPLTKRVFDNLAAAVAANYEAYKEGLAQSTGRMCEPEYRTKIHRQEGEFLAWASILNGDAIEFHAVEVEDVA